MPHKNANRQVDAASFTFRCTRLVADAENNSILVSSILWISLPALSILLPSTHVLKAHSHKHTHAHTHSHLTRAPPPHTHSLMVTPSHTFTHAHTCTHSHTGTHTHIGTHKLTQAHTCTHMLTHIHTCSHNPTHAHTCSYTHAHMLTRTYTHAHPHTCTHMHSLNDFINIPVLECFSLYVRLAFLKGWFAALPSGHGLWKCLRRRLS